MSYIQERKDTKVYYRRPPWRGVTNKYEPFQCRHLLCGGFTHSSYRASQKRCFFRFKKDRNHHEQQMWLHNQCHDPSCQACKHWKKKGLYFHTKAMQLGAHKNKRLFRKSKPSSSSSSNTKDPLHSIQLSPPKIKNHVSSLISSKALKEVLGLPSSEYIHDDFDDDPSSHLHDDDNDDDNDNNDDNDNDNDNDNDMVVLHDPFIKPRRPSTSLSNRRRSSSSSSKFHPRPSSEYHPRRRTTVDFGRPISATVSLAARRRHSSTLDQSKLIKRFSYKIDKSSKPRSSRHVDPLSDELLDLAKKRQVVRPHSALIRRYRHQHLKSPNPKSFVKSRDPLLELFKHDSLELSALEQQSGEPNLRRKSWVASS